MKKKILLVLGLILLVGLFPLMAKGQEEIATGPASIEVYYPVAVDAPIAKILKRYVVVFEKDNPTISVKPVFSGGYGDTKTAVQTTIEGGGKAPAMAVLLATDLYDLINADYIEPLDSYLNVLKDKNGYMDDFFKGFLENSRYDGKVWSLPFQRSAVVMYYNKSLFKNAGLSAPDSWDSWGASAAKLTERSGLQVKRWGIQYPSGWPYWLFQPLAIGAGRNIVGDSDTEVYFNYPEVINAVKFYISLSARYKATPPGVQSIWGAAPTNFASEGTAMIVHSTGSLTGILKQAKFDVGVMPVPGKKKGTYASVPGGGNLYILKKASAEEKKAAFKFALFLTEPQRAADFSINTGYIATRKSAYSTDAMAAYLNKVPQAGSTRDALKYAGRELSVQNLGKVRNIFHKYLQAAFNSKMSPEDAMAKAQTEADAALKEFK